MNDFIEENKKTIVVIAILVVLTIIFSVASMIINNGNKKMKPEDAIEELGRIYYEEVYYPQLKENYPEIYKDYLSQQTEGIKVILRDLFKSISDSSYEPYSNKEGELICDFFDSYVTITPVSPYDKDSYNIDPVVDCD